MVTVTVTKFNSYGYVYYTLNLITYTELQFWGTYEHTQRWSSRVMAWALCVLWFLCDFPQSGALATGTSQLMSYRNDQAWRWWIASWVCMRQQHVAASWQKARMAEPGSQLLISLVAKINILWPWRWLWQWQGCHVVHAYICQYVHVYIHTDEM